MKVRCVAYSDKFSINNSSFEDLKLGHEYTTVGCNSSVFGASVPGDFVIITAKSKGERIAVLGVLVEKVDDCLLWQNRGGKQWKYNFKYQPLTDIFKIEQHIFDFLDKECIEKDIKSQYFFHSRFCGARYKDVFTNLVRFVNKINDLI